MRIIKKIKYPLTILLIIIISVYFIYLKSRLNNQKYTESQSNSEEIFIEEQVKDNKENEEVCTIDIKGAIKNPNVYQMPCNSNVNDAIKIAGGITANADTSVINLAKKISNEMVIIIYTKDEVKNSNIVDTVIKVVEKECVCPNIQNDGCLNTEIKRNIGESNLVNINTATQSQLEELPGIVSSKAKAIIEYREKNGKFETIEDLQKVEGIGIKMYEAVKEYITT